MIKIFEERVVLVDPQDNPIGTQEKLKAHRDGQLHRAVSVFIFNQQKQLLLQQRAQTKYHSGGLWSNTCCGHPRKEESPLLAAKRRLWEEMGIQAEIKKSFESTYHIPLGNGLIEYEFDHVFIGFFEGSPAPVPEEVSSWKWIDWENLKNEILNDPEKYTIWFKILLDQLEQVICF